MNVAFLYFFLVCLEFIGKEKSKPTPNCVSGSFGTHPFSYLPFARGHLQCHFMFSSLTSLTSHSFSCPKLLISPAPSGSLESLKHWFYGLWLPWDITQADFGLLLLWLFVCRSKMAGANLNLTVEASTQLSWWRTL